jgi:hypothetical protein
MCEAKEMEVSRLTRRRADLADELSALDSSLSALTGGKAAPGRRRASAPAARKSAAPAKRRRRAGKRKGARGPRGEEGLQNMIRQALAGASEPMKLADLAAKVLKAGYQTSSKKFGVIVGQRLSEMKDVKKAGRGLYIMK